MGDVDEMLRNVQLRIRRGAWGVRQCLGIVVTLSSAACAPPPDQSAPTVDYYRTHREERIALLAECTNDPGGLGRTPACINAREAERIEGIGSLRDLPPLGLQPAPKPDAERDSTR